MPVARLGQRLGPGTADPGGVGRQVLDVVGTEITGDLVECRAAVRRVPAVAHSYLVEDGGVPGMVEGGGNEPRLRGTLSEFVKQRAQAQLGKSGAQLVQTRQLPRSV